MAVSEAARGHGVGNALVQWAEAAAPRLLVQPARHSTGALLSLWVSPEGALPACASAIAQDPHPLPGTCTGIAAVDYRASSWGPESHGRLPLALQVAADNKPACRLYERNGFSVVRRTGEGRWRCFTSRCFLRAFLGHPLWLRMEKRAKVACGAAPTVPLGKASPARTQLLTAPETIEIHASTAALPRA